MEIYTLYHFLRMNNSCKDKLRYKITISVKLIIREGGSYIGVLKVIDRWLLKE